MHFRMRRGILCRGTKKDCLAWEDDKKSRHSTSYTTHKGRWQGIDGKCFDNTFLQYDYEHLKTILILVLRQLILHHCSEILLNTGTFSFIMKLSMKNFYRLHTRIQYRHINLKKKLIIVSVNLSQYIAYIKVCN